MLQFVLTVNVEGMTYSDLAKALRDAARDVAGQRYDSPIDEQSIGDMGRISVDVASEGDSTVHHQKRIGSWHIEDATTRYGGRL